MIASIRVVALFFGIVILGGTAIPAVNQPTVSLPSMVVSLPLSTILEAVNETTLRSRLLAIQGFGSHPTGSEALKNLENYLISQLSLPGLALQQIPWRSKLRSGVTIQATIMGKTNPNNILILCAHTDSIPVSPGVDDDGSGTAAVLVIAQVLRNYQFNSTIRFVFFSGEEQGLLASTVYADNARKNHENIIGVIALDGIGYANPLNTTHRVWNNADPIAYWMVQRSQAVAALYPELIGIDVVRGGHDPASDHQPFLDAGYAGEVFREEVLNPFYHTSDDTIDHVDLRYFTNVSRLAAGTIASIAELQRVLTSDQIKIRMRGTLLSMDGLFKINITNLGSQLDTANLSVQIALKNGWTWKDLRNSKNLTMNWTLTPEINGSWEFRIGFQKLKSLSGVLEVTVNGIKDDEGLYQHQIRYGVILFQKYLLLFP